MLSMVAELLLTVISFDTIAVKICPSRLKRRVVINTLLVLSYYLLLDIETLRRFIKYCDIVAEEVKEKLSLEADNKVFFFDTGENQYGDYLRISEVYSLHLRCINTDTTLLLLMLYSFFLFFLFRCNLCPLLVHGNNLTL